MLEYDKIHRKLISRIDHYERSNKNADNVNSMVNRGNPLLILRPTPKNELEHSIRQHKTRTTNQIIKTTTMTCPKNADEHTLVSQRDHACLHTIKLNDKSTDVFYCTRNKGHRGKHHAHGERNFCIKTWTTTEEIIQAL